MCIYVFMHGSVNNLKFTSRMIVLLLPYLCAHGTVCGWENGIGATVASTCFPITPFLFAAVLQRGIPCHSIKNFKKTPPLHQTFTHNRAPALTSSQSARQMANLVDWGGGWLIDWLVSRLEKPCAHERIQGEWLSDVVPLRHAGTWWPLPVWVCQRVQVCVYVSGCMLIHPRTPM